MQRVIIILIIALALVNEACNDQSLDELKMGEEYIDDESGILLIDTFSLALSTVLIDSISTSASSSLVIGQYNNTVFGKIGVEPVYSLDVPFRYDFEEEDVFDSITISIDYNGYTLGDTTSLQTINVMELDTDLDDFESYLYNTTRVKTKEEALGQISFYPKPTRRELLEMRLNDDFGQRIFDLFINEEDEIANATAFNEYFKGIVLQNELSHSLLGLGLNDSSLCVNMYYHRVDGEKQELKAEFEMRREYEYFSQVKYDRSQTLFAPLVIQEEDISSLQTNDITLLQGMSGLLTKVRFPGLAKVFQLVKLDQIIKVELILVPTQEAEDINSLPLQLLAYESNKVNKINDLVDDGSGNAIPLLLYPASDNFESHPYYSMDITSYIISNLVTGYFEPDNAILVGLPSEYLQNTAATVMFGGEQNTTYQPKLKIYTYYY
ncbi:DUF4270 family protein [Labilibacter marinus]|uniref:DUF4270 family protein n=1 Tax=Labilibacter marinus TaxID=1477105 RepID=UPI00117BC414|nr:DUF4270 family protein [Labilibacter marinus]